MQRERVRDDASTELYPGVFFFLFFAIWIGGECTELGYEYKYSYQYRPLVFYTGGTQYGAVVSAGK